MTDIVYSSRYDVDPDPATVCQGPCEGMGVYPVYIGAAVPFTLVEKTGFIEPAEPDFTMDEYKAWMLVHRKEGQHCCNGYHFILCQDCKGTGKRA